MTQFWPKKDNIIKTNDRQREIFPGMKSIEKTYRVKKPINVNILLISYDYQIHNNKL